MIKRIALISSLCLCLLIQNSSLANDSNIASPFKQKNIPLKQKTPVENKEIKSGQINKTVNKIVSNPDNKLGLTWAENSIIKIEHLISSNKIEEAKINAIQLESWLLDATEYHTELYKTLRSVEHAKFQADIERDLALSFAILRDKAEYQMAIIYIKENQPIKAVEKLVNVVKSQPRTDLGMNAYNKLLDIGFSYKPSLPEKESSNADIKPF